MSEMAPEPGGGGGNVFTRKYAGVPGWLILAGAAVLAYFIFRNNATANGAPNSTSGSGQQTTGDIAVGANSPSITINAPYSNTQTSTGTANATTTPTAKNPQPTPPPKPATKKNVTSVATGSVVVAPWKATGTPWNSTLSGISKHTGVSIATLLKLNPQIKNPNLIYAGEKVKY